MVGNVKANVSMSEMHSETVFSIWSIAIPKPTWAGMLPLTLDESVIWTSTFAVVATVFECGNSGRQQFADTGVQGNLPRAVGPLHLD